MHKEWICASHTVQEPKPGVRKTRGGVICSVCKACPKGKKQEDLSAFLLSKCSAIYDAVFESDSDDNPKTVVETSTEGLDDSRVPRNCKACGVRAETGHFFCTMCGLALEAEVEAASGEVGIPLTVKLEIAERKLRTAFARADKRKADYALTNA